MHKYKWVLMPSISTEIPCLQINYAGSKVIVVIANTRIIDAEFAFDYNVVYDVDQVNTDPDFHKYIGELITEIFMENNNGTTQ